MIESINIEEKAKEIIQCNPRIGRKKLSQKLGITENDARFYCRKYHNKIKTNKQPNLDTNIAIDLLQKNGYFITKEAQQEDYHFKPDITPYKGNKYRIAIIGDTQIGSKYQQMTHLHTFYKLCQEREIRDVFHCGDLTDGQSVYKGHEFELFLHGADAQTEYTINNYPEYPDMRTYFIGGNHDESHYKRAGVDVCKNISEKRLDLLYKGFHGAYFELGGIDRLIYLHHGRGGLAYARSYKIQKQVEQFAPDMKPFMFFEGHYHVSCYLPMYRNVVSWCVPCFQSQTPLLKAMGVYPEIGGIIMEFSLVDGKPTLPVFEFVPFHIPIREDFK